MSGAVKWISARMPVLRISLVDMEESPTFERWFAAMDLTWEWEVVAAVQTDYMTVQTNELNE